MKKALLLSFLLPLSLPVFSQVEDWDGIPVIQDSYGEKISPGGNWIIATTYAGGTVIYNHETGSAAYNIGDFGRGNCVAENGIVTGCLLIDDENNRAVLMEGNRYWTPDVFDVRVSGNIHGITPDATRICGVVGGTNGYYHLPFYADLDAEGNVGELKYLPFPDKDFLNLKPQYCSATWISQDGRTILGQMIDSRGFFVSPIIYFEKEDGSWEYELPSLQLFNPNKIPMPEPFGDIEDEYPDAPFPELENFMTPDEYARFQRALDAWNASGFSDELDPYANLLQYMTLAEYNKYISAVNKYNAAVEQYNKDLEVYYEKIFEITDQSVFFVRNMMALSADAKWLASSAQVDDLSDPNDIKGSYIPYLYNIETKEWTKIDKDGMSLSTNQVLPGGDVLCSSLPGDLIPARSYIYLRSQNKWMDIDAYISAANPEIGQWYKEFLTGDIIVGDNNGDLIYKDGVTITGRVSMSENRTVISGGVDGYVLDYDQYLTYVMSDLTAGIDRIAVDHAPDGLFRVFNLQGVKVLETKNSAELNNLGKGLFIINGKKVAL